ncbi:MAG: hypothetical protein JOZ53_07860, partial [Planctomycetaceae bacterium]|nr:hypothetical protein [Planctomycetaceae bacterium]
MRALLAVAQLEDRNLLSVTVPALPTLPPCLPPAITAKIDAVADKLQATVNTLDAALDK